MRSKPLFFIKIFAVVFVVVLLGVYFFIQARPFLVGPKISLSTPQRGEVFNNSYIKIEGIALGAESFSLNGRNVLLDSSGRFSEGLILAKGYNIIELSAKDRFGKTTSKKLEVVLK